MESILDLVYANRDEWGDKARSAFSTALQARYPRVADLTDRKNDERRFQLRVNGDAKDNAIPYAALLPSDQELSGGYGGMSFVMFPADGKGAPALIAMGVGTNGLAPDEAILGRPGHARKCAAIASWLNARLPGSAWAKRDPVRIDQDLPRAIKQQLEQWKNTCNRYGRVLYATFVPPIDRTVEGDRTVIEAITAFVDLFFDERNIEPKAEPRKDATRIRRSWLSCILRAATDSEVETQLRSRRFVVLEGPPGTGKTEMAGRLLKGAYSSHGRVIQFHAGTTYESFVGGLAPCDGGTLGFTFRAKAGHLMEAAIEAAEEPGRPYLLVIDEINRADLSKVLGEAIYLFESDKPEREVILQYDFPSIGRKLKLPQNLHVLGTMNSADRSIAILDVAVRRRFAFMPLWPQLAVVEQLSGEILQRHFHDMLMLFIEHAGDDSLPLTPGHSYFLGSDAEAGVRLATGLRPLLEEYLAQGYVAGFGDEIRAFIDRLGQTN